MIYFEELINRYSLVKEQEYFWNKSQRYSNFDYNHYIIMQYLAQLLFIYLVFNIV